MPAISFSAVSNLYNVLPKAIINKRPLSFEALGQAYGFVMYRNMLNNATSGVLKIDGLRDYAVIMINGSRVGILDRRLKQDSIQLNIPKGKVVLDILVENLGRINFGPYLLKNTKGITGTVTFAGNELLNWSMYSLPFDDVSKLNIIQRKIYADHPLIKSGEFNLNEVADTYLDMSNWGKGVVWVNGHNLGRYWSIGPQQSIYVPGEWLKKGNNKIIVFELLKPEQTILESTNKSILDQLK
jgi:beta-galactosidase